MDAFETIRIVAAKLHRQLVEGGADALAPRSLIEAAVTHFDLELTYLEPGNTALKGAKAVFDGQSGTICCENTGTEVDRALLVAHEIGHSVVHAKSSCCSADDIDPSRSMEAAPVGLQKVEDYGARERRELEANVFAREFIFPRQLARRLHVNELMTASEIATSISLPVPLVRQQILDVLLLPEIVPEPPKEDFAFEEDKAQEIAANHRNSPYQLRAGPGTGKTRTLVQRIQSLLAQGVHAPSSR